MSDRPKQFRRSIQDEVDGISISWYWRWSIATSRFFYRANGISGGLVNEKYCYQDLNVNCNVQGANYQWDELIRYDDTPGLQGLCPPGWHVPSEAEWQILFANWTNNAFAGAPLKYSGYSGFNALLSEVRHLNVQWDFQNFATFFWSSTSSGPAKAWGHGMNDYDYSVSLYPSLRSNAFSVRCVEDY
jgi:uncharacterized protein (TIGR02145 family)